MPCAVILRCAGLELGQHGKEVPARGAVQSRFSSKSKALLTSIGGQTGHTGIRVDTVQGKNLAVTCHSPPSARALATFTHYAMEREP